MNRAVKIIFTLSIILNIMLLGFIGGGGFRLARHFGHEAMYEKELASLPPDVQAEIRDVFAKSWDDMRALFKEERAARDVVRDVLNTDPFEPLAYNQAVETLNQIRYQMMQIKANKTGLIAEKLDSENRRKLAGYLMRRGGKKGAKFYDREYSSEPVTQQVEPAPARREQPFNDPHMLPMPGQ